MRRRRGVALLAALWLVVGIAAVALQFSLEAHERRTMGLAASERGIQRAAAAGALALVQARLDQALRVAPSATSGAVANLRSNDPWLDADSIYSGFVDVDSMQVYVEAHDLGEKLDLNSATEIELQAFFSFLLKDYEKSTQLSQTIMDWRDADSIPRPNGAERDAYIKAGMLALPTNAPFREVEEVRNVMGMTPDIYNRVVKYFTTRGSGAINVNTAPAAVLRALPGMTDATLSMILQMRSQGRRINSMNDIAPQQGRRATAASQATARAMQTQLAARMSFTTNNIELTITARTGPLAPPSVLTAIVQRAGTQANVTYRQW